MFDPYHKDHVSVRVTLNGYLEGNYDRKYRRWLVEEIEMLQSEHITYDNVRIGEADEYGSRPLSISVVSCDEDPDDARLNGETALYTAVERVRMRVDKEFGNE